MMKLREDTKKDTITTKLAEIIMEWNPSSNRNLDKELMPFYSYKEDLVTKDEIALNRQQILIPDIMKNEMLKKSLE